MAGEDEAPEGESQEVHEWSAFYDDEGRIYYYNSTTGESSWDEPEKYNKPPEANPESNPEEVKEDAPAEEAAATSEAPANAWVAYQDEEGREYYYNTVTEETTWDKPEGYRARAQEETPEDEGSPVRQASPDMEEREPTPEPEEPTPATPEQETPEETVDPAIKRLEEARNALNQTDAILEPGVMTHVMEVVTSDGGDPQNAIQALSESFYGETAACGLMGRWLADLKSQSATTDKQEQTSQFTEAANAIREQVQDVVNKIAQERFTKTGGDRILDLSKSEATFLLDMMESNRWRKLLIDLSASNKDSALLMYCLEQISKRGHHREIARRINQSDHFTVFNAMLSSELAVIGNIAVSSCIRKETSISLEELVQDLQRTCTSTAYTYMYAIEVLRHLVVVAAERNTSAPSELYTRVIRKWERLNEVLQGTMVDPKAAAGSTPLFRKRRLDVAVTISELNQRQRRRIEPSDDSPMEEDANEMDKNAKVETAVLTFLRKFSLGTQIDDPALDRMLPSGIAGDPSNLVGKILIRRPITIQALLGYMYKPGSQRVSSPTIKNKCAKLVALAVKAAEEKAYKEAQQVNPEVSMDFDEVAVTQKLSQGSRLCETVENMVSFLVTNSDSDKKTIKSPGEQLCSLAVSCAPVSQGVAIWAREITKGSDFVSSASYPTLSPSIMSLVRVVYLHHPFIRDDALEVALSFIKHTNSEINYQTMNEIKEQSLRLLMLLCARGEGPTVLAEMAKLLKQPGTSGLDAALIRYFVSGLLDVAGVPFSIPFSRQFCALMTAKGTVEAVKTTYFDADHKAKLSKVLSYLEDTVSKETHGKLTSQDASLIRAVVSIYGS